MGSCCPRNSLVPGTVRKRLGESSRLSHRRFLPTLLSSLLILLDDSRRWVVAEIGEQGSGSRVARKKKKERNLEGSGRKELYLSKGSEVEEEREVRVGNEVKEGEEKY